MSKIEKLLSKLLQSPLPMDFRWEELEKILSFLGYEKKTSGKTGGSRRTFFNEENGHIIKLHERHGSEPIKPKALKAVIDALIEVGAIGEDNE
ncbi:MAG: addiction module toxin, HicA family [Methylococcaceae bacterium]|nr:addiction module toxin, HicA family [Methylococcaceae bacterium]